MRGWVEDSHENSKKRLVDGKMDLAYKMNCTQMNFDKPSGIYFFIFYLVMIYFLLG